MASQEKGSYTLLPYVYPKCILGCQEGNAGVEAPALQLCSLWKTVDLDVFSACSLAYRYRTRKGALSWDQILGYRQRIGSWLPKSSWPWLLQETEMESNCEPRMFGGYQ